MVVRKSQRTEDRLVYLRQKISDADIVVRELNASPSWQIVLRDLSATNKKIDDSWSGVFDDKKLNELRITKLSVMYLINLLQTYESDKRVAEEELYKIMNPMSVVNKDYDTEGIDEQPFGDNLDGHE
jgi:hypothetical protein